MDITEEVRQKITNLPGVCGGHPSASGARAHHWREDHRRRKGCICPTR